MKKVYPVLILLIILACACKNTGKNTGSDIPAQINFSKTTYDFGVIPVGHEVICEFEFENTSEVPLLINKVNTSCGCTSPEWPKDPVKPGNKGIIKVKYNASNPGVFDKSITIFSNARNSPFILIIKGEVNPGK